MHYVGIVTFGSIKCMYMCIVYICMYVYAVLYHFDMGKIILIIFQYGCIQYHQVPINN